MALIASNCGTMRSVASNGPNRLGLCAGQETKRSDSPTAAAPPAAAATVAGAAAAAVAAAAAAAGAAAVAAAPAAEARVVGSAQPLASGLGKWPADEGGRGGGAVPPTAPPAKKRAIQGDGGSSG